MAETTEIAWCDSTWNPWLGCTKVSAGCDNCYAETLMDKRYHRVQWGPHGERVRTSPAYWWQPITWNKHYAAFQAKHGHRQRVFCASLADVFDNQAPAEWRADLIDLIEATPNLDWLLLTKRPENIQKMLAQFGVPANVWLGFTAEDQTAFDRRWPIISDIPASVRFCSYEPAIGGLTMAGHAAKPDWLIAGGESGQGHRPAPSYWFYAIKHECEQEGVPFFMKQMPGKKRIPEDLFVRQFPMEKT